MKIGIVLWDTTVRGGTQRQALCLARELQNMGHQVTVFATYHSADCGYRDIHAAVNVVSLTSDAHNAIRARIERIKEKYRKLPALTFQLFEQHLLARELAQTINNVDVLNVHDSPAFMVSRYCKKKLPKLRVIWMRNDSPLKRWARDRMVMADDQRSVRLKNYIGGLLHDWYLRFFYISHIDIIVVLDSFNKALVRKYLNRNAKVVRSGLDRAVFLTDAIQPYALRERDVVRILVLGIFFPHRRYQDVIKALSILLEEGYAVHLDIVGDMEFAPQYASKIQKLIAELKINTHVSLLGSVSDTSLPELYRSHDIFVFPNHPQTWGLAVFEAMASGCAVMASNTCGASEMITDGKEAVLFAPKKPQEIASGIKRLIDDAEFFTTIRENGWKLVQVKISWHRYATDMLTVFQTEETTYEA